MMAILGFIALVLLGLYILVCGLGLGYGCIMVGSEHRSDWIGALVVVLVGAGLLWLAFAHAPFTIVARGAA